MKKYKLKICDCCGEKRKIVLECCCCGGEFCGMCGKEYQECPICQPILYPIKTDEN